MKVLTFDAAFALFLRSAGDELALFMGEPPRPWVSREALETAASAILQHVAEEDPDWPFGEDGIERAAADLDPIVAELRAQAFEEVWSGFVGKVLRRPEKRAEMIAFIESRTGRPLPLDDDS